MNRAAPVLISALGVLGLALSLVYLWLVFMAFQPDGDWATNLLIGPSDREFQWTFLAVLAPYFMLVGHLYARTQLGHWLLKRGDVLGAIRYTQDKLESGLSRSHREALSHRLALGKAYAFQGRYDEAWEILTKGYSPPTHKSDRAAFARWKAEVALRRDSIRDVEDVISGATKLPKSGATVARFWGAVAEARAKQGFRQGFDDSFDKARWADSDDPRVALAQIAFVLNFDPTPTRCLESIESLDAIESTILAELPLRAGELLAWRSELLLHAGKPELARKQLERETSADAVSALALASVARDLGFDEEE